MHLSHIKVRGLRAGGDGLLDVELPGRFCILVGANGVGKTTICDAAALAHTSVFPRSPRVSAAALGARPRSVEVQYSYEADTDDEGPLGRMLQIQSGQDAPGAQAGTWTRNLGRSLGAVRAEAPSDWDLVQHIRFVHLPAWRNPLDELARREAQVLIELLRAQQQRIDGTRNLAALRGKASGLLEALAADELIQAVEGRIGAHLGALSAGVSKQWPFVRGQVVDDTYLARVLELMLAAFENRDRVRPLDVSGLGYVNLLHIAVTLAAIPDPALAAAPGDGADGLSAGDDTPPEAGQGHNAAGEADEGAGESAASSLQKSVDDAQADEDSFFPAAPFHATVIIEEPEAHLHPQLQHSLVRYLRRITLSRPELQIVLSSHAPDVITACDPEDVVVLRRRKGLPHAQAVLDIPLDDREEVLRRARLHLDATRSAALFADRLVIVEGVTDAILLREFGKAWAADDPDKVAFIDALSIVAMGTRIGSWPVRLLATADYELCSRLALLADSDKPLDEAPTAPSWLADHDNEIVRVFHSHPTLEPAITTGNESLVERALVAMDLDVPAPLDIAGIHTVFRGRRTGEGDDPATPAGPGASRKGEFALELAGVMLQAREAGTAITVPLHMEELFSFLHEGYGVAQEQPEGQAESGSDQADVPA